MTEANTITCPECGRAQRVDAPFCDNCGFRLGRGERPSPSPTTTSSVADTEVERPAVNLSELARDSEPGQPVEPPSGGSSSTSRSNLAETEVEGFDAVTDSGLGEPTYNEGFQQVPTERGHEPVPPPDEQTVGPRGSGLYQAPEEARSRAMLWATAWLVSLVAVGMAVWWYARAEGSDHVEEIGLGAVKPGPVEVGAGSFQRGLDDSTRSFILRTCLRAAEDDGECDQEKLLAGEYPAESVSLESYAIDRVEVTIAKWESCVAAEACEPIDFKACKVYTHQGLQISLRAPRSLQKPEMPVTCVSRAQAEAYCEWKGGRLPTHDEWERAARGAEGRLFPWGASWDPELANWGETDVARVPVVGKIDGYAWTAPPGQYPDGASPDGMLDAAGNVAEWVAGEPVAARGGSWTSNPFDLRTTGRLELDPDARRTDVGLRCAYDD